MLRVSAVLRCLGIPARVITNFNSAHDNTGNLKTDLIFNADGTPDRSETRDSIWLVQMPLSQSTPLVLALQFDDITVNVAIDIMLVLSGTTTAGTKSS